MADPTRPTILCLPFLGGSARAFQLLAAELESAFDVLGLDLPGFGAAAAAPGYTVAAMADHAAAAVRARRPGRWLLAGHSMGAKVACALARRAEDGDPGLAGLSGLVLLAGSPPAPEPMDEARRQDMLGWFAGNPAECRRQARAYMRANTGAALDPALLDDLVEAMLPARLAAWTAWLADGSREDWSARIGVLHTPALVLSGSEDADLGPAAQHRLMLPHLADADAVTLPGAGHLLPQERPALVAHLVAGRFAPPPEIPPGYRALIDSARVSSGTRAALLARTRPQPPARTLSATDRGTLRALLARVLPQPGAARIDLVAILAAGLDGPGDGWRFAGLPPDRAAWPAGLRTLDEAADGFAGRDAKEQDALLHHLAGGRLGGTGPDRLDRDQMRQWFEDVRAEATRHAFAHPATMARLRYAGIAYGGDGPGKPGFTTIGIGARDAWEPA